MLLIPIPSLLLAILQSRALVIFQHPVLLAKLSIAKTAVSYYTLCCLVAILERAFGFLGRATAEGKCDMEGSIRWDGEG